MCSMRIGSMSTVRLVSASSEKMLDDIAFTARVSNPTNQNNTQTSEKLVRYLI